MVLLMAAVYPSFGQSEQDNSVLALEVDLKQILADKDTAKFVSLIGPSGIVFGVGGDNQFKEQVQEQFEQKRAAYCFLFDSKCLARETPHKRLALLPCSVHDLISRNKAWSMEHQLTEQGGTTQVHLLVKPDNDLCSNGKDSVEFVFVQVADGWKLVGVGYE
jgi:hypothetical protein